MAKGYDISQWQGDFDFATAKRTGTEFVIIRASYGKDGVDPKLDRNVKAARAAGMRIGFYHFAYPQFNTSSAEAAHFISTIRPYLKPGDLVPALDHEVGPKSAAWAYGFLRAVEVAFGCKPMYYSYVSFITGMPNDTPKLMLKRFPLWLAAWDAVPPHAPGPWDHISIWQRADHDGAKHLDVDASEVAFSAITYKPEVAFAQVKSHGKVVARIRYGGGRVAKFLSGRRFAALVRRGVSVRRVKRRP